MVIRIVLGSCLEARRRIFDLSQACMNDATGGLPPSLEELDPLAAYMDRSDLGRQPAGKRDFSHRSLIARNARGLTKPRLTSIRRLGL